MSKTKKTLLMMVCAVMLVLVSVMGTMAYLTSTDSVTNTFTVGNVAITLDETDVDNSTADADRDKANAYNLLPGHKYTKDPIIHVAANSEDCYLFVKVEDEIAAIEDAKTVATQMSELGWTAVEGETNIFAYDSIIKKSASAQDVKVFNDFTIKGDVNNTTLAGYKGKTIKVTAYAVQADGFTSAEDAWDKAF